VALATALPALSGKVCGVEIEVTWHAIQRWIERVEPGLTLAEAREHIMAHSRALEAAASIGCSSVRLSCGSRLILDGHKVVTIYPPQPRILHSRQRSGRMLSWCAVKSRKHRNNGAMK